MMRRVLSFLLWASFLRLAANGPEQLCAAFASLAAHPDAVAQPAHDHGAHSAVSAHEHHHQAPEHSKPSDHPHGGNSQAGCSLMASCSFAGTRIASLATPAAPQNESAELDMRVTVPSSRNLIPEPPPPKA